LTSIVLLLILKCLAFDYSKPTKLSNQNVSATIARKPEAAARSNSLIAERLPMGPLPSVDLIYIFGGGGGPSPGGNTPNDTPPPGGEGTPCGRGSDHHLPSDDVGHSIHATIFKSLEETRQITLTMPSKLKIRDRPTCTLKRQLLSRWRITCRSTLTNLTNKIYS
jgi:hypothetical protein